MAHSSTKAKNRTQVSGSNPAGHLNAISIFNRPTHRSVTNLRKGGEARSNVLLTSESYKASPVPLPAPGRRALRNPRVRWRCTRRAESASLFCAKKADCATRRIREEGNRRGKIWNGRTCPAEEKRKELNWPLFRFKRRVSEQRNRKWNNNNLCVYSSKWR